MDNGPELLKRLKQGEESAWDETFRILYPCAFAAARHPSVCLTPEEAEDVAVEALEKLVPKVVQVGQFDELRALVVTIAARAAISLRRKLSAQKRGSGQTLSLNETNEEGQEIHQPVAPVAENLAPLELRELSGLLKGVLGGMDDLTRQLVEGNLARGKTYRQLAEEHAMPIGTVGVRIARGLKKMREQLEKRPELWKELRNHLR
ncbi:MAG: RNA polymerase sigma factor [Verrucomicrobiae bacterium]|nr:RNA polymerase sigma factor [Verrucomicrobiae bacterium]